jgi:hypothetical protein
LYHFQQKLIVVIPETVVYIKHILSLADKVRKAEMRNIMRFSKTLLDCIGEARMCGESGGQHIIIA